MSRLIDAEALKKEFGYTDEWYKGRTVCAIIDNAPTMPLQDAIHNYLLTHTTLELLEVLLKAVEEYER